jgi:alkaline phosphatase
MHASTRRLAMTTSAVLVAPLLALAADPPRQIIVMIGDGTGFNQLEAASLYRTGKRRGLPVQQFPVRLAASTFAIGGSYDPEATWKSFAYAKTAPTDSAAAGTALATGYKTLNGCIGIVATNRHQKADTAMPRTNVLERAEARRKSTGVVTTVPLCHATPASFLAHAMERSDYAAIARQMFASAAEVVIGCGHPNATNEPPPKKAAPAKAPAMVAGATNAAPPVAAKPAPLNYNWVGGEATWKQALAGTLASDADADGTPDPWTFVQETAGFLALTSGPAPRRLLGVVKAKTTLQQARGGDRKAAPYAVPPTPDMPRLADLTRAALNVLDDNPNGFVLMVEGGAVDWACHDNQPGRCIEEALDFSDAVDAVTAWVSAHDGWDRTLLIVTADHETGYLVGPGSGRKAWWRFWEPVWKPLKNNGKGQLPGMEWQSKTHTNHLVPVFAKGAGAETLKAAAKGQDPVRGAYLDNTDIARTVFELLR